MTKITKRQIKKAETALMPITNSSSGSLQYLNELTEPFRDIPNVKKAKQILSKLIKDVSHEWMQAKNHYDRAKTFINQAAHELVDLGIPSDRVSSLIKSVLTKNRMFSHTFISKALPEECKLQYRIENAKKGSETRLANMKTKTKDGEYVVRADIIHRTPRDKEDERMIVVVRHATPEYREYWLPVIVRCNPGEHDATVEFDVETYKKHNEEFQRSSRK